MYKRESSVQRWRVSMIRGAKNQVVGIVLASDKESAIEAAIIENKITDLDRQRRLVAWPEND